MRKEVTPGRWFKHRDGKDGVESISPDAELVELSYGGLPYYCGICFVVRVMGKTIIFQGELVHMLKVGEPMPPDNVEVNPWKTGKNADGTFIGSYWRRVTFPKGLRRQARLFEADPIVSLEDYRFAREVAIDLLSCYTMWKSLDGAPQAIRFAVKPAFEASEFEVPENFDQTVELV